MSDDPNKLPVHFSIFRNNFLFKINKQIYTSRPLNKNSTKKDKSKDKNKEKKFSSNSKEINLSNHL